jgi:hypothetical protein
MSFAKGKYLFLVKHWSNKNKGLDPVMILVWFQLIGQTALILFHIYFSFSKDIFLQHNNLAHSWLTTLRSIDNCRVNTIQFPHIDISLAHSVSTTGNEYSFANFSDYGNSKTFGK